MSSLPTLGRRALHTLARAVRQAAQQSGERLHSVVSVSIGSAPGGVYVASTYFCAEIDNDHPGLIDREWKVDGDLVTLLTPENAARCAAFLDQDPVGPSMPPSHLELCLSGKIPALRGSGVVVDSVMWNAISKVFKFEGEEILLWRNHAGDADLGMLVTAPWMTAFVMGRR